MIPREGGHWSTIYGYFKRWRRAGVWADLLKTLRQWERRCLGQHPEPSAGSIDSQSIQTATQHKTSTLMATRKSQGASGISWWTP
jgi:putative transposase